MVKLYIIEGAINAGKSSLIQRLKLRYRFDSSILFLDEALERIHTAQTTGRQPHGIRHDSTPYHTQPVSLLYGCVQELGSEH